MAVFRKIALAMLVLLLSGANGWADNSMTDAGFASGVAFNAGTPVVQQPDARAAGPSALSRSASAIYVTDDCPITDGSTDNTSCIQAAVNKMCSRSNGGGTLFFPAGRYVIRASIGVTISCPAVFIQGAGGGGLGSKTDVGASIMIAGSGSAPIFHWNSPVRPGDRYFYGGGISDVGFYASNPYGSEAQTGPMFEFDHCFMCVADHIFAQNPYRFAIVYSGFQNSISNFGVSQLAQGGEAIRFYGSDRGSSTCGVSGVGNCPTRGDVLKIDSGHIDNATDGMHRSGACIRISDFAATTWIADVTCNQAFIGLKVDCPDSGAIGDCPQFISIWDLEVEVNSTGDREGNSKAIGASDFVHLFCHDCQLYGSVQPNNLVNVSTERFPGSGDVQFFGGKIEGAKGDCVWSNVEGFQMHGGLVAGCNEGNRGGDGLYFGLSRAGAKDSGGNIVEGVAFCYYQGAAPSKMGGVHLAEGTDFNIITGNTFRGCANGGVSDNSGGTHEVNANNSGP